MENLDALLAILLLKQPLAESFRVFNNPAKILLVDSSSISELKEFLLLCAYLHTVLNALLAEYQESSMILASI
jgi:hypothetical protein